MKKLRKKIAVFLITLLVLGRTTCFLALAEELEENSLPSEEQIEIPNGTVTNENSGGSEEEAAGGETLETEISDEAEVINNVDSEAISGENSINQPSPTPTPILDSPSESSKEESELESELPLSEEVVVEPSVTPTPETSLPPENSLKPEISESFPASSGGLTTVETAPAISIVEAENSVNSNEINSQVLYQTLNIFIHQGGGIDLAATPLAIAANVFEQKNNQPVINVLAIDNQNFAYLSNDVVSFANSGGNTAENTGKAVINTGDAYSVVSLLNKVNTTIVDSVIHVVTINIFGVVDGDIILPELSSEKGGCEGNNCGEIIKIENKATVNNNINSLAISGQNSISTSGEASITTGEAASVVNLANIVNTNLLGVTFRYLFINTFGSWLGNFLGWDIFGPEVGGGSLAFNSINSGNGNSDSCFSCVNQAEVKNEAEVINNISSTANTGGNTIKNNEGGTISSGNAYSVVSLINLVNTSIINSLGFFGFVNIFGLLNGDIGGASLFKMGEDSDVFLNSEEEMENIQEEEILEEGVFSAQESGSVVRSEGGLLEISQSNNVGTHVLPGDTVTFFIRVKNPGTGPVYEANLKLNLLNNNGTDVGGVVFNLGNIDPGRGFRINTGLVLSKNAKSDLYVARAVVTGYVGPDNKLISASADSSFRVRGLDFEPLLSGIYKEVQAAEISPGETLGENKCLKDEDVLPYVLLFLLSSLWLVDKSRKIRIILPNNRKNEA